MMLNMNKPQFLWYTVVATSEKTLFFRTPTNKYEECLAPMVWAFLSTTVQLPATKRKVEGEERETQLIEVNEASSCIA